MIGTAGCGRWPVLPSAEWCHRDGQCQPTMQDDCSSLGGAYHGAGTPCRGWEGIEARCPPDETCVYADKRYCDPDDKNDRYQIEFDYFRAVLMMPEVSPRTAMTWASQVVAPGAPVQPFEQSAKAA
jgi:hypothetical protein